MKEVTRYGENVLHLDYKPLQFRQLLCTLSVTLSLAASAHCEVDLGRVHCGRIIVTLTAPPTLHLQQIMVTS